jgi:hypothetical protein
VIPTAAGISPAPERAHGSGLDHDLQRLTAPAPLETRTNRVLALGIGLLLAVIALRTQYIGTPTDFSTRVAPVDLLCVAMLAILFLRHRMSSVPVPALLYVGAVALALVPGLMITPGPERDVWLQFSAVLMAFGFYLIGLNLGASPTLLRWLLAGVCIAVLAESVVIFHDTFSSHMWFPDPMEHRVRGTFKTNGQLGAFGFCAAGLLITFGGTLGSPGFRRLCAVSAILSASFVFPASRRMGMLSVFAWGALFAILGWRFAGRWFYQFFVGGLLAVLVLLAAFWPQVEASFAGRRFRDAVVVAGSHQDFIQNQFRDSLLVVDRWFPFGFGLGRGAWIDPRDGFEIHNCFLAVLVEMGVLGLLGYAGMVVHPFLRRRWQQRSRDHELMGVLLTTTLLISVMFMLHNTLYRDRTFLLFLGVATAVVLRESRMGATSDTSARTRNEGSLRESWGPA